MHNNHFEAIQSLQKLAYLLTKDDFSAVDVSVHPPFTDIRSVQTLIDADEMRIHLGAQNCHWEEKGAFTGEISPIFLFFTLSRSLLLPLFATALCGRRR